MMIMAKFNTLIDQKKKEVVLKRIREGKTPFCAAKPDAEPPAAAVVKEEEKTTGSSVMPQKFNPQPVANPQQAPPKSVAQLRLDAELIAAIHSFDAEKCEEALKKGADVNAVVKGSNTPLIIAVEYNKADIVEVLLKYNPDLNHNGVDGTALMVAAGTSTSGIIELLIAANADLNATGDTLKETALIRAVKRQKFNAVELLIKSGADVNKPNAYGKTPLMFASSNGDVGMVDLLVKSGATG